MTKPRSTQVFGHTAETSLYHSEWLQDLLDCTVIDQERDSGVVLAELREFVQKGAEREVALRLARDLITSAHPYWQREMMFVEMIKIIDKALCPSVRKNLHH